MRGGVKLAGKAGSVCVLKIAYKASRAGDIRKAIGERYLKKG